MTPKQEARAKGLKRYIEPGCAKHPELGGERIVSNGNCLGCERARQRTPEHRAKKQRQTHQESRKDEPCRT